MNMIASSRRFGMMALLAVACLPAVAQPLKPAQPVTPLEPKAPSQPATPAHPVSPPPATPRPATTPADDAAAVSIEASDKAAVDAALGKKATILGTVATAEWSPSGKVMKIEFKGNDQSKLLAVAFVKVKPALDTKFGGNAAEGLVGKSVRLTGKIVAYTSKGDPKSSRPEVVIDSADQINVVDGK